MSAEIINKTKEKMTNVVDSFKKNLSYIRAGRASSSLLDRVFVDYYGTKTPVNQMASISVPEARMLVIQPYDRSVLNDIERAISKSDLGISPSNDGNILRLVLPVLTEERRKDLVKQVKKTTEEAKIAIRTCRRNGNDDIKKSEKVSGLSEDQIKDFIDDIQKLTDDFVKKVDGISSIKEQEIMEV